MKKKRPLVHTPCFSVVTRVNAVVHALRLTQQEFLQHGDAPPVHVLTRRLDCVVKAGQDLHISLKESSSLDNAKIATLVLQGARDAVGLTRTVLQYENMFDHARNAPTDMKRHWLETMAHISRLQTGLLAIIISLH